MIVYNKNEKKQQQDTKIVAHTKVQREGETERERITFSQANYAHDNASVHV